MGPLVLAKNFTVVLDSTQTFLTDWIPIDPEFQNGTIHVHCQTISPTTGLTNGIAVSVDTSYDTVEANQIGTTINLTGTGSSNSAVSSNIASMVRLELASTESFAMWATVSVYLQPKSE